MNFPLVVKSNYGTWGYDAYCYVFFTIVKPTEAHRKGLLAHEAAHARQFLKYGGLLYVILYFCSAEWRYKFELEAYRKQCEDQRESTEAAARVLATRYNIGRSYEECLSAIAEG